MFSTFQAVRAEALFLSGLQRSQAPGPQEVRAAVTGTLRHLDTRGCAALVAAEFGDHPETAAPRMAWAADLVRSVYPARHAGPHRLALAA